VWAWVWAPQVCLSAAELQRLSLEPPADTNIAVDS